MKMRFIIGIKGILSVVFYHIVKFCVRKYCFKRRKMNYVIQNFVSCDAKL